MRQFIQVLSSVKCGFSWFFEDFEPFYLSKRDLIAKDRFDLKGLKVMNNNIMTGAFFLDFIGNSYGDSCFNSRLRDKGILHLRRGEGAAFDRSSEQTLNGLQTNPTSISHSCIPWLV